MKTKDAYKLCSGATNSLGEIESALEVRGMSSLGEVAAGWKAAAEYLVELSGYDQIDPDEGCPVAAARALESELVEVDGQGRTLFMFEGGCLSDEPLRSLWSPGQSLVVGDDSYRVIHVSIELSGSIRAQIVDLEALDG